MAKKKATPASFKPGNPGKPKGAVSAKTKAWEQLGEFLTQAGAQRAVEIMMSSDEEDFMKHYSNLLEYFRPKHSRSDITQTNTGVQEIVIKRESTDNYAPVISAPSGTTEDTSEPQAL